MNYQETSVLSATDLVNHIISRLYFIDGGSKQESKLQKKSSLFFCLNTLETLKSFLENEMDEEIHDSEKEVSEKLAEINNISEENEDSKKIIMASFNGAEPEEMSPKEFRSRTLILLKKEEEDSVNEIREYYNRLINILLGKISELLVLADLESSVLPNT
jgi:hypothetical protein